jgi:hypothetical protein
MSILDKARNLGSLIDRVGSTGLLWLVKQAQVNKMSKKAQRRLVRKDGEEAQARSDHFQSVHTAKKKAKNRSQRRRTKAMRRKQRSAA